jgi:hypothetical protein
MTKADELNALADRCEREEPSLELSEAIARWFRQNDYEWWRERAGGTGFTTSLDAAVSLVGDSTGGDGLPSAA